MRASMLSSRLCNCPASLPSLRSCLRNSASMESSFESSPCAATASRDNPRLNNLASCSSSAALCPLPSFAIYQQLDKERLLFRRGFGLTLFGDQIVDDPQRTLVCLILRQGRPAHAAADTELAGDNHFSRATDAIAERSRFGLQYLCGYRVGIENLVELRASDTLGGEQREDLVGGVQHIVLNMDGLKKAVVQAIELEQRVGGVKHLRVKLGAIVPDHRRIVEINIRCQGLLPRLYQRIEMKAVSAAVGKHFDHFDFGGIARAHGVGQAHVILAFDKRFRHTQRGEQRA